MAISKRSIEYTHDGKTFEGLLTSDGSKKPAVLVSHAWAGRSPSEDGFAVKMAEWGYTGFSLDLYGKGVLGSSVEENQALMTPLMEDRPKLQDRLKTVLATVREQPEVDADKVAIIGFCFGGLCALDLARIGTDIKGAASFHGLFTPPGNTADKITAKVIAFHGWDDPMAQPDTVLDLATELTKAGADWQIHGYGNTMHAFMNPEANDPSFGTVYSPTAERRAWASLKDFLEEVFA